MLRALLLMSCKSYLLAAAATLGLSVPGQAVIVDPEAPIGAPVAFEIQSGIPSASYFLDLSATGTTPGLPIPGTNLAIPLNPPLIYSDLFGLASPAFTGFYGITDPFGQAVATMDLPSLASLVGLQLHASFVVQDPLGQIDAISPAVPFRIVAPSASGWTALSPSPDSRRVYVSDSLGNDSNTGLSENQPVRTLVRGVSLLRSGFPDWLHLRRGDVWTNQSLGHWNKSGRSSSERMVVTTWGNASARPMIRTPETAHGLTAGQVRVDHVVLSGFHILPHSRTAASQRAGVQVLGPSTDIIVEDVCVEGFKDNLVIQAFSGPISDFRLRRSLVLDAHCSSAHSQGAFFKGVDGVLLEENLFDHNGWKDGPEGAPPTVFNHNVYMQADCRNLRALGNVFARGAATGLMGRCGGTVENNLFVRNPVSLTLGYTVGANPTPGGVTGIARGNVILEGSDILPTLPRALAIVIGNVNETGITVADNIIAHAASAGTSGRAIQVDGTNGAGVLGCTVSDNLIYSWSGSLIDLRGQPGTSLVIQAVARNVVLGGPAVNYLVQLPTTTSLGSAFSGNIYHSTTGWFRTATTSYSFPQWIAASGEQNASNQVPPFPDPDRSVAGYVSTVGGPADLAAFLARARAQSRPDWDPAYTAAPVIRYIRAGFGR